MKKSRVPALMFTLLFVSVGAVAAHDANVPVSTQWSTRSTLFAIGQYRHFISPHLKGRIQCRFQPTCSLYGQESVRKYGFIRGGWRTVKRISRCRASTPLGTIDPP